MVIFRIVHKRDQIYTEFIIEGHYTIKTRRGRDFQSPSRIKIFLNIRYLYACGKQWVRHKANIKQCYKVRYLFQKNSLFVGRSSIDRRFGGHAQRYDSRSVLFILLLGLGGRGFHVLYTIDIREQFHQDNMTSDCGREKERRPPTI